jgi:hypothetical protein
MEMESDENGGMFSFSFVNKERKVRQASWRRFGHSSSTWLRSTFCG